VLCACKCLYYFVCNMFRNLLVFNKFHVCFSVLCDTCFFVISVKDF
jgi:hypothetical protein